MKGRMNVLESRQTKEQACNIDSDLRWTVHAAMLLLLLLGACVGIYAQTEHWTPFYGLRSDVSVSFNAVDATTYTWKLKNDGRNTVVSMTFTYSYVSAQDG